MYVSINVLFGYYIYVIKHICIKFYPGALHMITIMAGVSNVGLFIHVAKTCA